jgi:hypothetical protein
MKTCYWIFFLILLASCRTAKFTKVDITGVARNTKGGSVVIPDDGKFYFVDTSKYWDDEMIDKHINVKGDLEVVKFKTKRVKDNQLIDQISGMYLIHTPKITLIDSLK